MKGTRRMSPSVSTHNLKRSLYWVGRRLLQTTWLPSSARSARPVRAMARRACRVHPPVTDDLAEWCGAHGVDSYVLSAAEISESTSADCFGNSTAPELRATADQKDCPTLPGLPSPCVRRGVQWPCGSTRRVVCRRSDLRAQSPGTRSSVLHSHVLARRRKEGDYFSLLGKFSNSGNYYHWIHDGLLRLHGAEQYLPRCVKYLVPPTLQEFQRETLNILGLREEQLVPFRGDEVWECERLWFASMPPSGAEVTDAVTWLRERFFLRHPCPSRNRSVGSISRAGGQRTLG